MTLPGETEAGSAGKQPCRGIARRAHRDDDHGRGSPLSRSSPNPIGSIDPDALKIPARRAASTLTRSARSPVPAEPAQAPIPVVVDGPDLVYLLLFGTGIRGFSSEVRVRVGGEEVPVLAAVAQGQYPGLDQVNAGPLPASLAGAGEVAIEMTVDDIPANDTTVTIE